MFSRNSQQVALAITLASAGCANPDGAGSSSQGGGPTHASPEPSSDSGGTGGAGSNAMSPGAVSSPAPSASGSGHALDPETAFLRFSHRRGLYDAPFELSLSTNVEDGEIRYTVDGTEPAADRGTVYSAPIAIADTTLIRAAVVKAGAVLSDPETLKDSRTHSYIYPERVVRQADARPMGPYVFWTTDMDPEIVDHPAYRDEIVPALYSIPTLSAVTDPEKLFGVAGIHRGNNLEADGGDDNHPEWVEEVETSLELIYPPGYPRGDFVGFQQLCGIRIQGGGGRWDNGNYDHKQSFGLRFRKEYSDGQLRYPIFEDAPLHGDTQAGRYDKLVLRAGHNESWGATWDPETSVYTRDQLGRDLQLALSGVGSRGTFVHLYLNGLYWGLYNLVERPDDAFLASYFGGEESDYYSGKAKTGDVDGDPAAWNAWNADPRDLEAIAAAEYADIAVLNVYAATGDFPQYYFGNRNNPLGPIHFIQWDTEDAFGGGRRRTSDDPDPDILDEIHGFSELWGDHDEFRALFADRAVYAAGTVLSDDAVAATWKTLTDYIESAMVAESARWGDERTADTGTRFTRDEHWAPARDAIFESTEGKAARLLDALRTSGHLPEIMNAGTP